MNNMETKLVKTVKDNYILVDPTKEFYGEGYVLGTTVVSDAPRLSLKNCQAIELGYDLDELVKSKYPNVDNEDYEYFSEAEMLRDEYKSRGFYEGAKAIIELMGDKKFSEEDMRKAMDRVWDWCEDDKDEDCSSMTELRNKHIQSLQQTEWNVEIVMDMILVGQCDCPCHSDGPTIMHFMACCHPKMVESPKLDADGCLILKRK